MNRKTPWRLSALAAAALLSACGGSSDPEVVVVPEPARPQDSRSFTADATITTFAAMAADASDTVVMSTTSRWAGVQGGAAAKA